MNEITLEFVYSRTYDSIFTEYEGKEYVPEQALEVADFLKVITQKWREIESEVFSFIAKITHSSWKVTKITCYVVKYCKKTAFSRPLTVKMDEPDRFISALMHELLHLKLGEDERFFEVLEKVHTKFPNEEDITKKHLIINLLHIMLLRRFYDEEKAKTLIDVQKNLKGLKRSWEIVEKILPHLKKENLYDALYEYCTT